MGLGVSRWVRRRRGRPSTSTAYASPYTREGSGPAIVCLHAIAHGASDWVPFQARLRARHRIVAVDWPGHGASAPDRAPACAARYAALLGGVLDRLGLHRVVLVGNSIGGAAAIRYAHANPARVRGLVLANPGGLAAVDDVLARGVLAVMARFFAAGARGARWWPAAYAAFYRMVLPTPVAAAQRARIVAAGREMAPALHDAWRSFADPGENLRPLAPEVRCPVLVTWAVRDRVNQLGRNRAALARFPDVRLETFAVGHAPQLEAPDTFAASVERFVAALPG